MKVLVLTILLGATSSVFAKEEHKGSWADKLQSCQNLTQDEISSRAKVAGNHRPIPYMHHYDVCLNTTTISGDEYMNAIVQLEMLERAGKRYSVPVVEFILWRIQFEDQGAGLGIDLTQLLHRIYSQGVSETQLEPLIYFLRSLTGDKTTGLNQKIVDEIMSIKSLNRKQINRLNNMLSKNNDSFGL